MFVDASALTAMITAEADADALSAELENQNNHAVTSPLALYETALAVARKRKCSVAEAFERVSAFLDLSGIELVEIPPETAALALDAHARYGKGTSHPAQLNMGDCFAYACARAHGVALLYKGDDFVHTDLA